MGSQRKKRNYFRHNWYDECRDWEEWTKYLRQKAKRAKKGSNAP